MPNIESVGNYEGVVDLVYDVDEEKLMVKAKVTTDDGRHGYPCAFIANKDGGRNEETIAWLERMGWDCEELDGIKRALVGKRVSFYAKANGQYMNFYFATKPQTARKPVDKPAAQSKWAAIRGASRLNKAAAQAQAPDLDISEESIPF